MAGVVWIDFVAAVGHVAAYLAVHILRHNAGPDQGDCKCKGLFHELVQFDLENGGLIGEVGGAAVGPVAVNDDAQVEDQGIVGVDFVVQGRGPHIGWPVADNTVVAHLHPHSRLPLDRGLHFGPDVDLALPLRTALRPAS